MTYSKEVIVTLDNGVVERDFKVLVEAGFDVVAKDDPYCGCPGGFEIDWMSVYDMKGKDITTRLCDKHPKTWDALTQEIIDHAVDYADYLESFDPRYER